MMTIKIRIYSARRDSPPSAPLSVSDRNGVSPFTTGVAGLLANDNCVAVRRGGEQSGTNRQSIGNERDSAVCVSEPAGKRRSSEPVESGKIKALNDRQQWKGP